MNPNPLKILLLFFHPRYEDSKANKVLLEALHQVEGVTIRDMYELYPDFNIHIEEEQQLLLSHDIIIWQHPFYWYSCPPLMKQWIDLVLEYGWAYGKNGDKLSGKRVMNVITSGGTFDVYQKDGRNRFTYRELLSPFDQTVYLCAMHYLPPFIVPGAPRLDETGLNSYAQKYIRMIHALQENSIHENNLGSFNYINDITEEQWLDQFYKMP